MFKAKRVLPMAGLLLVLLAGIALRLFFSTLGNNFDVRCWNTAAGYGVKHLNVYLYYANYNYGPMWFCIVTPLKMLQNWMQWGGIESFHLLVVAVLSMVDAIVTLMLLRRYGWGAALFFFLNPVMILLTGFHSQVDTLAISFALGAWLLMEPREGPPPILKMLFAALLMGLSLSAKHIFIFFPIWVLFAPAMGSLKKRFLFAGLVWMVFAASFIPFANSREAISLIYLRVIKYNGFLNTSLFTHVLNLFVPFRVLETWLLAAGKKDPFVPGLKLVFAAVMLLNGWWFARKNPKHLFPYYLLAFCVFSIAFADQYMAIPMVACAMFIRRWPVWIYSAVAVLILIVSPFNISSSTKLPKLTQFAATVRDATERQPRDAESRWLAPSIPISHDNAVAWLLPLLLWEPLAAAWKRRRGSIEVSAKSELQPAELSAQPSFIVDTVPEAERPAN